MNGNEKIGAYLLLAMHGYTKEEIKEIMEEVKSAMKNEEGEK
ncbi:hypothetical protein Goe25_01240 [Bacillus phage vB_BsuM-Goe25]|nr:hypothetical protein Goe25_01240 [Bacillus phage vB_BsuM-Goe25]